MIDVVNGSEPPSVPFDSAALHRMARRVFNRSRPYTVARLGGLDLVLYSLYAHGLHAEADRLAVAAQPLADAADAGGIVPLAEALAAREGRPSRNITGRLRCDEMETALASAFTTLGWSDMLPMLATWSPSGARAVEDVELTSDGVADRRSSLLALMRRAREFEAAWVAAGAGWDIPVVPVDGRTLKSASRSLGLSLRGEVAAEGEVPMSARHANRLGRSLVALALSRIPAALTGHAPSEFLRLPLSILGAVAESLRRDASAQRRSDHVLRVRGAGVAVPDQGWTPVAWWPALDAWGSTSSQVQAMIPMSWGLSPVDADVTIWALAYATALIGTAADAPNRRMSAMEWELHVESTLDPVWGIRMDGVWDLVQTPRLVAARAPFPSGYGSPCAFSRVDPADPSTLPWLPGRAE